MAGSSPRFQKNHRSRPFGGITVRNFIITLMIGVLSGTYSSIFNAAQILVAWETGEVGNFFRRLTGRAATA